MNINEWEAFSQMGPTIIVSLNDLDMIERHEFDRNYQWDHSTVTQDLHKIATHFIHVKRMNGCSEPTPTVTRHDMSMLSPNRD